MIAEISYLRRFTEHPITGKWARALWIPNAYGLGKFGVRFPGDKKDVHFPAKGLKTRNG